MKELNDLNRGFKVGILDIETTGLKAPYADLVCICIKEVNEKDLNGKIHIVKNETGKDEKKMLVSLIKIMNEFDLLLGWYSSRFDFRFLNVKAVKYRVKPPIKQFRRDLLYVARANFALRSNRLAVWIEYLFGRNTKTTITPEMQKGAIRGEKWAIDKYVHHCQIDVRETEKVYKKFLPYISKRLRKGG